MRGVSSSRCAGLVLLIVALVAAAFPVPSVAADPESEPVVIAEGEIVAGTYVSVGPIRVNGGDGLPVPPLDETIDTGGFAFDAAPYQGWTMWTETANPMGVPFDLYATFGSEDGKVEDDCEGVTIDVETRAALPSVRLGGDVEPCQVPFGAADGRIVAAVGIMLEVTVFGVPPADPEPVAREPFAVVDVLLGVGARGLGVDGPGAYVPGEAASPRADAYRLTSDTQPAFGEYALFAVFEDAAGQVLGRCDPDGQELDCIVPAGTSNLRIGAHLGVGLTVSLFADEV